MGENKGKNKGVKNLIPIKKGERLNPNGRPLGQKNYATLYREALIRLGELNNKEPDEIELEMIAKGLTSARSGDFRFYKDVLDRLHGAASSSIVIEIDDKTKETSANLIGSYLASTADTKPTE